MRLIHKLYIKLIKNFSLIKIKYLFIIFLLSPFLIFIVLIKPIVLIRFGSLGCERIGAISYVELYLLVNKFKKKVKSFDIWVTGDFISNEQYLIILKSVKSTMLRVTRMVMEDIGGCLNHMLVIMVARLFEQDRL